MPVQGVAKHLEGLGFAWLPAPFDELHHGHLLPMAEGAQHQAQSRSGFALAIAGEHHHQAFFLVAFSHPLPLHLLAALHAAPVGLLGGLGGQVAAWAQLSGGFIQL